MRRRLRLTAPTIEQPAAAEAAAGAQQQALLESSPINKVLAALAAWLDEL